MGVSVHYRGQLEQPFDPGKFESELVRIARALGAEARIPTAGPFYDRQVRGAIVLVGQNVEPASLLVSAEGWLVPISDAEEAERTSLTEAPWVSVKTQFGPVEAHVALIDLLAEIQRRWAPSLCVHDEGEYWGTRSLPLLNAKRAETNEALALLSAELEEDAVLRPGEREDPVAIEKCVRHAAAQVQKQLWRRSKRDKLH